GMQLGGANACAACPNANQGGAIADGSARGGALHQTSPKFLGMPLLAMFERHAALCRVLFLFFHLNQGSAKRSSNWGPDLANSSPLGKQLRHDPPDLRRRWRSR
ncbi:MAG: hypothetical protein AAF961_05095, partial [Planctomycetota bacterium]